MNYIVEEDKEFCNLAIQQAKESFELGAFPAGAVIVRNGEVLAKSVSAKYPEIIYHAESNAVDLVMQQLHAQLSDCVLYSSMEPCLMCLSRAYWAGIRKVYFALPKSMSKHEHYESTLDVNEVLAKFNDKMIIFHIPGYEQEVLSILTQWESANLNK